MKITQRKTYRAASALLAFVLTVCSVCAVCPPASAYAMPADTAAKPADTAAADPTGLSDTVREVGPTVVGIMGKLSKLSKDYYDASDNIVLGSGIIYKSNGYIVTNCHVVEDCESLFVILSDRKIYKAETVGVDAESDLALIKIDKGMLTPVVFANSSAVEVGASVFTIGTPVEFGLQNSVGLGIISGINRGNTGFTEYEFLQTDAIANPGNSGGPLMNMDGEVLGIVEGGYASYSGITFCIPSQTITYIVPQLLRYGRVRRPDLGARLVQSLLADYGLPSDHGLFFADIAEDGPCAAAGIDENDALISINGTVLNSYSDYAEELKKYLPGDTVELVLLRDGTRRAVSLTFAERQT